MGYPVQQRAAEQRRRGSVGVAGGDAGQPGGPASHRPRAASEGRPTWQVYLDRQVAGDQVLALEERGWLIDQLSPNLTRIRSPQCSPDLLAAISRAGVDARQLLCSAITAGGPQPDDHAAPVVCGGSAGISPHGRRPGRHRPYLHHGLVHAAESSSAPTGPTPSSPACGGQRSLLGRPRPAARLAARRPSRSRRHARCRISGCSPGAVGASRCWPTRCPPTSRASRP